MESAYGNNLYSITQTCTVTGVRTYVHFLSFKEHHRSEFCITCNLHKYTVFGGTAIFVLWGTVYLMVHILGIKI